MRTESHRGSLSRNENMTTTSLLGAARYGVKQAPTDLALVQELLNTAAGSKARLPDLLEQTAAAGEWLRELLGTEADETTGNQASDPTPAELRKLRELRSNIAASLSGAEPAHVRADLRLELQPSGEVEATLSARPVPRLLSAVLLQAFLTQRSGEWQRLKICANPNCNVSFYDRSKNRSGVWHDVHTCGNAINLRASRSRRRTDRNSSVGVDGTER
jgi:hypothetical protein